MGTLTTIAASREFRVHPNTILRLIALGKVKAQKDRDGKWLIERSSIERWQRQRLCRRRSAGLQESALSKAAGTTARPVVDDPVRNRTG